MSTEDTTVRRVSYGVLAGALMFLAFIAMTISFSPRSEAQTSPSFTKFLTGICHTYDADGNGDIDGEELDQAVADMGSGQITLQQFQTVVECFNGNTDPVATDTPTPAPVATDTPTPTATPPAGSTPTATPTPTVTHGCALIDIGLVSSATKRGEWSSECYSLSRDRRYARYYRLDLSVEASVQIDLESSTDTYLFLHRASSGQPGDAVTSRNLGTEIASNDDGFYENYNSRISETLSAGTYNIEATTYGERRRGSFTVEVRVTPTSSAATPTATATPTPTPTPLALPVVNPACGIRVISEQFDAPGAGESTIDRTYLDSWDPICTATDTGLPVRHHIITLREDRSHVTIDLRSNDKDPKLILMDSLGTVLSENDNNEEYDTESARIALQLDPGVYTIDATYVLGDGETFDSLTEPTTYYNLQIRIAHALPSKGHQYDHTIAYRLSVLGVHTATPTPTPRSGTNPNPRPRATDTPTPTATATDTPTPTPTSECHSNPGGCIPPTPTDTPTPTNTPTATATATNTPIPTPTPSCNDYIGNAIDNRPPLLGDRWSWWYCVTPTPTPTNTPVVPVATDTPTPLPPLPTIVPPTATNTPRPTATPTNTPCRRHCGFPEDSAPGLVRPSILAAIPTTAIQDPAMVFGTAIPAGIEEWNNAVATPWPHVWFCDASDPACSARNTDNHVIQVKTVPGVKGSTRSQERVHCGLAAACAHTNVANSEHTGDGELPLIPENAITRATILFEEPAWGRTDGGLDYRYYWTDVVAYHRKGVTVRTSGGGLQDGSYLHGKTTVMHEFGHVAGLSDLYLYETVATPAAPLYPGYIMDTQGSNSLPLKDIAYLRQVYRNKFGAEPHN